MAEVQPRVFISYARSDDEPFVERLHRDLEAAGIYVWWDRDTMASRGRTFLQEIRDAIEAVDRVIAVIGPGAIHSDYVRYEWGHALLFAKGLLPILRLGDYRLVPSELWPEHDQGLAVSDLGRLHCPDFRAERTYEKALDELVAIIRQPVPCLASYDGTPALPPHFLPRRDDLHRLKEAVLADILRPTVITSAQQTVALQGMGGIGKSVLAAAFARAISTRRAMGDGIVWLSAGQDANKPTLLNNMKTVGTAFGDAAANYSDEESARKCLSNVLANKVCLLILDDVWSIEQVEPFRDTIGPRCRLLITTRDGSLVTRLDAQEHGVDVLSDEQALALLADWSGQVREALPEGSRQVAKECGNLPFALALCGAMARDGERWLDMLDALREADLTFIEGRLPRYDFPNVLRALRVSVDMLGREDPAAVGRYHDLVVFPSKAAVPEAAVVTLWCRDRGFSERQARKLLTTLGRKAMLTVHGDSPHRHVSFHDLQYDYLRAVAGDEIVTLHDALIETYRSKCSGGWASGPNDGYFFQFLPTHLAEAGRKDELKGLLTDYAWLAAKLKATDVPSVLADYQRVPDEPHLRLIARALRLSTGALARDLHHLPSQLIGRLRGFEDRRVQVLLKRAGAGPGAAWLCPHTASLLPPGPLSQTLFTDHSWVTALAVLPDGRVVSGSWDRTLRVWDVASGASQVLKGHTDWVTALAVLPDGRVVSGSWDRTLRVWDVASGASQVLKGHTDWVTALAVLPDGRVVSGSRDRTLRVWEVDSGASQVLKGHTKGVTALAVLPERRVVSGSQDMTLRVWDVASGASRVLEGHTDSVSVLAVLPERRVVSGSLDKTLRVWEVDSGASRVLEGHRDWVTALAVLPDGRVVSGSKDGTLRVWGVDSGASRVLEGHRDWVTALAVLPDERVVSGSDDRTLRVWEVDSGASRVLEGHTKGVTALAVLPDERVVSGSEENIVVGSRDQTLRVWEVDSGASRALEGYTEGVTALAVLPDGRVVSGSEDGTLWVWDVASGASRGLGDHTGKVTALAVLPDGRVVSGMSWYITLRVWDVASGASRVLEGHTKGMTTALAVLPDGRVVSGSKDGTLWVWDVASGASWVLGRLPEKFREWPDRIPIVGRKLALQTQSGTVLEGHTSEVTALAVLPDGRVVSGSLDRTLRVWDVDSGVSRVLEGHTKGVRALAVLPDGRVVSGSDDRTLRVWDVDSGVSRRRLRRTSRVLEGHTEKVTALAVLPDGRVVSGSDDWAVILWDLDTAKPMSTFVGDAAITTCVAASIDHLVVGSANGAVHILELRR